MTIRVGIVGTGFIARYHAMQLQLAAEPCEIVAVHDADPARAEAFVAEHGGEVVGGLVELVGRSDAVFVCTWTAAHLEAVQHVAAAGVPVFCEKPLSTDLEQATELVDHVERAGLLNVVGLVLRSSPAVLALRELVREPSSGSVVNVVFRDDQYLPTQGMYGSTWRADPDLAGSGVLLEHSIHDVDLLEWLIGEVRSVSARQSFVHGIEGIEDSVAALVEHRNGATSSLTTVWHDVLSRPSQRRIEVFCERALVTLEGDIFGPVRREDADGVLELDGDELIEWLRGRGVPLVSAEQEFLVAVRSRLAGATPPRLRPDVHDALRAHVLVDAVYRSARSAGAPVAVAPAAATTTSSADGD